MLYAFFASPYFDHDAFMHHAVHVLNALVHSLHGEYKLGLNLDGSTANGYFQFVCFNYLHIIYWKIFIFPTASLYSLFIYSTWKSSIKYTPQPKRLQFSGFLEIA